MTRREIDQLRHVFANINQALARLGDLINSAERDFRKEDAANTALEQSSKGAANDQRSV